MKPVLNKDGSISLASNSLSTEDVDLLIHDLAMLRGSMNPPVPKQIGPDSDAMVTVEKEPAMTISRTEDGDISIGFRHPGFGWFFFALTNAQAEFIRSALAKRLANVNVNVISEDGPDANTFKH